MAFSLVSPVTIQGIQLEVGFEWMVEFFPPNPPCPLEEFSATLTWLSYIQVQLFPPHNLVYVPKNFTDSLYEPYCIENILPNILHSFYTATITHFPIHCIRSNTNLLPLMFWRPEVSRRSQKAKIKWLAVLCYFLEVLEETQIPSSFMCWQNSVICGIGLRFLFLFLVVGDHPRPHRPFCAPSANHLCLKSTNKASSSSHAATSLTPFPSLYVSGLESGKDSHVIRLDSSLWTIHDNLFI